MQSWISSRRRCGRATWWPSCRMAASATSTKSYRARSPGGSADAHVADVAVLGDCHTDCGAHRFSVDVYHEEREIPVLGGHDSWTTRAADCWHPAAHSWP